MPTPTPVAAGTTNLVADLAEDLQTRWAPDVIADADIVEQVSTPRLDRQDVHFINVPRVGGGFRMAPVLSGSALAVLRNAVQPFRAISETVLHPAVCGYRVGADGSTGYSDEYRRFRSFAAALAESSSFVIVADVRNFFDSIGSVAIHKAYNSRLGTSWEGIHDVSSSFRRLGVPGLPAGYGDARLIANGVLAAVDESIGVPFTRWVDDYRLFAGSLAEAEMAVRSLRRALESLNLTLNEEKLLIEGADEYRRTLHGVPLDSVYHPQDEPSTVVQANLRSVFTRAVASNDRRQLRFALPRLAEQLDDIAIPFAMEALARNNIDAPRLVFYLSHFMALDRTYRKIETIAKSASVSEWTLLRLVPLLCRLPLSPGTADILARRMKHSRHKVVKANLMRLLALHGHHEPLESALKSRNVPDARAALAACWDLNRSRPSWLADAAPGTAKTLDVLGSAPLPAVASLL